VGQVVVVVVTHSGSAGGAWSWCMVMVMVMVMAAAADGEMDDGRRPGRHAHRVRRGRAEIKKGSTHASRVPMRDESSTPVVDVDHGG
jgi:hypothetical protein